VKNSHSTSHQRRDEAIAKGKGSGVNGEAMSDGGLPVAERGLTAALKVLDLRGYFFHFRGFFASFDEKLDFQKRAFSGNPFFLRF
jgi:hypothetical protein